MLEEKEVKEIKKMRERYEEREEDSSLEKLKKKDKKVRLPAEIFAYTFGIIGALVLGVGMCMAMEVIGGLFVPGIVIGVVGIAMVCVNYFIYKAILSSRKKKYAKEILEMSSALLNEKKGGGPHPAGFRDLKKPPLKGPPPAHRRGDGFGFFNDHFMFLRMTFSLAVEKGAYR